MASPDQYLGTILVVPRRERARDVVLADQAKTKAVPSTPVLLSVVLEVLPEVVGEPIPMVDASVGYCVGRARGLAAIFRVEDAGELGAVVRVGQFEVVEADVSSVTEADDEYPFPMLGNECLGVYDPARNVVAEFTLQRVQDYAESATFVVIGQVLHVFEDKGLRAVIGQNPRHVKEQRALSVATEPVRLPERVLLAHACDGKRLARESGEKHVMGRDAIFRHFPDVADHYVSQAVIKVRAICLLRVLVDLTREDARAASQIEPATEPADTGEEVYETKRGVMHLLAAVLLCGAGTPCGAMKARGDKEGCQRGRVTPTEVDIVDYRQARR